MGNTQRSILDKLLDIIFAKDKTTLYLCLIFAFGFLLRIIAAINLGVAADDMHHTLHAINFLNSGKLVLWDQSSGLWHSLTSLFYQIFGVTQLGSRFASVLFGSFSILVMYLLTKEFFGNPAGLFGALLLATAPFHIKSSIAEMDVTAMFFVLTAFLVFVYALKAEKKQLYILSGAFMGLAIYTKVYPILFVPSLLAYFIFVQFKKRPLISKENTKKIIIFLLPVFLFSLPTLTHNYLLYKDKGFVDYIFTNQFHVGLEKSTSYYAWSAGWLEGSQWKKALFGTQESQPIIVWLLKDLIRNDPVNFILAILGLLFFLLYKRESAPFITLLFFSLIITYPFMTASIILLKHFIFFELLIIPLGAFSLTEIKSKLPKFMKKDATKILGAVVILINLALLSYTFSTVAHFYGKSYIAQLIDFKESVIPKDALIIADSRIYRGQIHWVSQGRPYMEGSEFIQLLNQHDQLPGTTVPTSVYYIECVLDDCGWGTVKDQPDFNKSMESLTEFFNKNSQLVKTLSEPNKGEPYFPFFSKEKIQAINIYHSNLQLKDSVVAFARQPKNWFLYDIGYEPKEKQFDYYTTHSTFDRLLNNTAQGIKFLAVALALLTPFYIIYLLGKEQHLTSKKEENLSQPNAI